MMARKRFSAALVAAWTLPAGAEPLTVTNTSDSGPGSLRQAITIANGTTEADTIQFAPGVTGTIVLAAALPELTEDAEILGPGASVLTVSGNNSVGVFSVAFGVTATFSGLTIADGSSGVGAGIRSSGTVTINDSVLRNNSAGFFGGAISIDSRSMMINRSTITGNSSAHTGGGIDVNGTLILVDSTISGNAAGADGGGLLVFGSAKAFVMNSTVSNNSAAESGGGVHARSNSDAEISNSTISGNSASDGGGVFSQGNTVFKNLIVADNPAGGDCAGSGYVSSGESFDTDGTCTGFIHVSSADLALGPLQDNGGPTRTHGLPPDSTAVDAVTDCTAVDGAPIDQDQRGRPRPFGPACDAGAFEFQNLVAVVEIPAAERWGLALLALVLAALGLGLTASRQS